MVVKPKSWSKITQRIITHREKLGALDRGDEMARKIFSWTLIVLSVLFLLLSAGGIFAILISKGFLERKAIGRLTEIDSELQQGQAALENAQMELEHALSIVDSTEEALNKFTQNDPQAFFEKVQTTLDGELIPELETAKGRLVSARDTLQGLRTLIFGLKFVPFIKINIPDQTLTDLIDSADSLQAQIKDVGELAKQASLLLGDASDLMGGNLTETRDSLQSFLTAVKEYQTKVAGWRAQIADLNESLPKWINGISFGLIIFLIWFGFSQFGLLLHGLNIRSGADPLGVLRRKPAVP
jgi:peptidoglycan hydrolase CwlO-like protein